MRVRRFASPGVLVTVLLAVTPLACSAAAGLEPEGRGRTVAVEVGGRSVQIAIPAGMSDAPELLPRFAGALRSKDADARAVFWPDSSLAVLRAGQAIDAFEVSSAVVAVPTGALALTARQLREFFAYEWMNKEKLLWSSSTEPAEFDRVQRLVRQDPEGRQDLPLLIALGSKVGLEYIHVEDRAGIVLQLHSAAGGTTGGSGSGTTLRAMATVIVKERVVSLMLIRTVPATTRTVAELNRDARAWVERTLAANDEAAPAQVNKKGSAADSEQILPKLGEFVYVEEMPEAIRKVRPVYPEPARKADVEGVVKVRALLGQDGRVKDTRISKSIPPLDRAAATAVRQWTFKPARAHGKPVAVWVEVPVSFTLE